jgi:hypothetical protein
VVGLEVLEIVASNCRSYGEQLLGESISEMDVAKDSYGRGGPLL